MKIFVIISMIGLLLLLIQNRYKPFILFGGLACIYYILGLLDLQAWTSSYTNSSLLILLLLLVISLSIEKTILIKCCSEIMVKCSYNASLLRLGVIVPIFSALLNNTAVVASLMSSISNNNKHLPSKLLIPLSYFAIFGGTMTLVGTSTNLIVNSFVIESGLPSLEMFDFLIVGGLITIFGVATVYFTSFLLPSYETKEDKIEEHLIEANVVEDSWIIGRSIKETKLNKITNFSLVEIQRGESIIIPVDNDELIQSQDKLVFSGDIEHLEDLKNIEGLTLCNGVDMNKLKLVDTIITPQSNLVGLKVKDINFKGKFDATIVSFKRGSYSMSKIPQEIIHAGDRLVLAVGKNFQNLDNITENFYTISSIKQNIKFSKNKSFVIASIFILIIGLSAFGLLPLLKALLVFLFGLLIFKAIDLRETVKRFPYDIFIIVGSSLAISKVLIDSGIADDLASIVIGSFGSYGIYGSFIGIYFLTLLLTEMITNNAAAALSFPIAYATALGLGVDPTPFIFAVAYGASASFMMPYGYQTNLMVRSLGNYKTKDFLKIGWIVSVVYSLVVIVATPIFFPFY